MTTKEKVLAELVKCPHGASTRHLFTLIFTERLPKNTFIPGIYRVRQLYGHLRTLKKKGKVISDYPGHWKIKPAEPKTNPSKQIEDFETIYEKDMFWGDYLKCNHCGERVERGLRTVSHHWMHCLKRTKGLIIVEKNT